MLKVTPTRLLYSRYCTHIHISHTYYTHLSFLTQKEKNPSGGDVSYWVHVVISLYFVSFDTSVGQGNASREEARSDGHGFISKRSMVSVMNVHIVHSSFSSWREWLWWVLTFSLTSQWLRGCPDPIFRPNGGFDVRLAAVSFQKYTQIFTNSNRQQKKQLLCHNDVSHVANPIVFGFTYSFCNAFCGAAMLVQRWPVGPRFLQIKYKTFHICLPRVYQW